MQPEELSTPPEELSTPPTANAVAAKLRDGPSVGSGQLRPSTVSTGSRRVGEGCESSLSGGRVQRRRFAL